MQKLMLFLITLLVLALFLVCLGWYKDVSRENEAQDKLSAFTQSLSLERLHCDSLTTKIVTQDSILVVQDSLIANLQSKSYRFDYGQLSTELPTGYSIEYQELGSGKREVRIIAPMLSNLTVKRSD